MKAIILAAGTGSRLRPLTNETPKCLVEVNDKKLLEYQLSVLKANSKIEEIIIITGYLGEQLAPYGDKTIHNDKFDSTNMVFSLFAAYGEIKGDVLLAYGDIVYSPEILNTVLESTGDISIAVDSNWYEYWQQRFEDPLVDAETLKLNGDNIIEIGKKPKDLSEIEGQYMGLMKFNETGSEILRKKLREIFFEDSQTSKLNENSYMTDLLEELIEDGEVLTAVCHKGDWVEVDNFDDLNLRETKKRLERISRHE